MYLIARADLPQPHLSVQLAHAALAAERAYGKPTQTHPNLVLCTVPDEAALLDAFERLKQQGVPAVLWREDDLGMSATSVGTGPLRGEQRRFLRGFRLLK